MDKKENSRIEVIELKLKLLELDFKSFKELITSKKEPRKRLIENSHKFSEYVEATEAIIIEKEGFKLITAKEVSEKLKEIFNYEMSPRICGKVMKSIYSKYSVKIEGKPFYKLTLKNEI